LFKNYLFFALEDTKGPRYLLSFIEKKVAKKATTASKPEVPSLISYSFSTLQNSLKYAPSIFLNTQTVSGLFRKERTKRSASADVVSSPTLRTNKLATPKKCKEKIYSSVSPCS